MNMKKLLVMVTLAGTVSCVSAPPPVQVSSPPAAGESAVPSSPQPSATVAPSVAPGLSLGEGEALKPYNFQGVSGLYRDPLLDQLYVVDAADDAVTTKRYVLRKFAPDGSFLSTAELAPQGEPAPDAVDGVAFDYRGFPVYAYREDEQFRLLKLVTATVVPFDAADYPVTEQDRAGVTTVRAADSELLVAAISLERDGALPDRQQLKTGGKLIVARAEEDKAAKTLFQIPDPLYPTVRMAFAPGGSLFVAGPSREGKLSVMRVDEDQKVTTLPVTIGAVPDRLWVSPEGELWLSENRSNGPAKLRRFTQDGEPRGEAELRLAGGGYLTTLLGMVVDGEGRLLVAGQGFDDASRTVKGLFRFGRPQ